VDRLAALKPAPSASVAVELQGSAASPMVASLHRESPVDRAALLAEATSDLALSLDVEGSLQRLAQLVVPAVADWAIIDLAGDDRRPIQVAMAHRDGMEDVLVRFAELQPAAMTDEAPIMRVLNGAAPIVVAEAMTSRATQYVSDRELLELCDTLGICSAMYVPMTARGRVLGCVALVSGRSGRVFTDDDLDFAADLGRRAALVVDNTRLYEREHRIAQVLQESLLPVLPDIEGLDLAAVYLPSDSAAQVGGDFFDLMALPDGSTALAVGDVFGHDLAAATAMGQIRVLLRAGAWESATAHSPGSSGAVLCRLDQLVQALELTTFATVLYAQAARAGPPGARWRLSYASAGHPAPLLRSPEGDVVALDRAGGVALGVTDDHPRGSGVVTVEPGSVLVAFTDGLVERRDEDWDDGVSRIWTILAGSPPDISASALADGLASVAATGRGDDVAILVVRFA
jgi:serine phosphatase RsbU (regulator of sigma subunit)